MNTDKEVNKVMMNPAANSSPTILDSTIAPWVIAALAMKIMATAYATRVFWRKYENEIYTGQKFTSNTKHRHMSHTHSMRHHKRTQTKTRGLRKEHKARHSCRSSCRRRVTSLFIDAKIALIGSEKTKKKQRRTDKVRERSKIRPKTPSGAHARSHAVRHDWWW